MVAKITDRRVRMNQFNQWTSLEMLFIILANFTTIFISHKLVKRMTIHRNVLQTIDF